MPGARRNLLHEPLLHFLLLGAAIFVAHGLLTTPAADEPGRIVITRGQVAALAESFARTWQRPPTGTELEGLVRDRVRDEVYYREAIALGLDKDDAVVRRRLRQKMEFVSDDVAAEVAPTDADLNAYLQAHPDPFRVERRFTFRQVYLDPAKHGENLEHDAAQLLARLNRADTEADTTALGDSRLLAPRFEAVAASEVAKQFGESFAIALGGLTPGRWSGPVESGYGVHLVRVDERTDGRLPALDEVREAVRREWENTRRLAANDTFYAELLRRYTVTIERPEPAEADALAAGRVE